MNPTTPQNPKRVAIIGGANIGAVIADRMAQLRGEFTLVIKDKSGKVVETYEDKNLIVNLAKTSLARLLAGAGGGKQITKIAFGTSTISPDVEDSVITNSIVKNLTGAAYPEFNSVAFSWLLDYPDANGVSIAEFGLLCLDDTLFARKTRTAIAKTADLQLTGTWKIVF